jgi:hypothetical protein
MVLGKRSPLEDGTKELCMKRIRLVLGVIVAVAAAMAFAGPAFAGTDGGSCLHVPLSPLSAAATPVSFSALLVQVAVAAVVVMAVAVALSPRLTVRWPRLTSDTQVSS